VTRILVLQGPNMEYLGQRQLELYGTTSATALDAIIEDEAARLGVEVDIFYTNHEGAAIDRLYKAARDGLDGLLMNPAGFVYAGYALADCLRAVAFPCVEIHMTNIEKRGMRSATVSATVAMIAGLGVDSYILGLRGLVDHLGSGVGGGDAS
jgi:3-dehydroquinate dehydratase-2